MPRGKTTEKRTYVVTVVVPTGAKDRDVCETIRSAVHGKSVYDKRDGLFHDIGAVTAKTMKQPDA